MILVHEIIEWFNCPLTAFRLIQEGCNSFIQASRLREAMRVIVEFENSNLIQNATPIITPSLEESVKVTLAYLSEKKSCVHAVLSADMILAIHVPFMEWHNKLKGWVLYLCATSPGLKNNVLQMAALTSIHCQKLQIPIAQIQVATYNHELYDTIQLHITDITHKAKKYQQQAQNKINELLQILETPNALKDETYWHGCKQNYCDTCAIEQQYDIDDVRTIRKSKQLTIDLLEQGIEKITEIPSALQVSDIAARQIKSVKENTPLLYYDEIERFIQRLTYPRYYLDFEAFTTSVPYHKEHLPWKYIPFLFSLQWQNDPGDVVHTQLWAMPPSTNMRLNMWKILKPHLKKAGTIIAYDSHFEASVLTQLAEYARESSELQDILPRIMDLQKIFYQLSAYHPKQKGKISLKTIASVWLNISYEQYKVSEGIAANYYFVMLSDKHLAIFDTIIKHPYFEHLYKNLQHIENQEITLADIAHYCKHDTEVMVKLVAKLEQC